MRIAVGVSGRGSNLRALLDARDRGRLDADPAVVFSNDPAAPALALARDRGVATIALNHRHYARRADFDAAVVAALAPYDCRGAVLAGYMRIVTPAFLNAFPAGVLNIHPSLLPAFPGRDAVRQAWEYGVRVIGCTVHFVDDKVDHGPIVAQTCIVPPADGDWQAWQAALLPHEHVTLVAAVDAWSRGAVRIDGRRVVAA